MKNRMIVLAAAASVAALPAGSAGAAPTVNAAFACDNGSLPNEFYNLRAHGMKCRAARRAVKRGKFTGGFRYRFTTPGYSCRKTRANYAGGRYKCRDGGRVFSFRYRNPENPDAG